MMSQPDGHRTAPTFSIVVPVYNEAESLPELLASIAQAIAPLGETYEVVFVDDGSTDGSFDKLRSLGDPRARPGLLLQAKSGEVAGTPVRHP